MPTGTTNEVARMRSLEETILKEDQLRRSGAATLPTPVYHLNPMTVDRGRGAAIPAPISSRGQRFLKRDGMAEEVPPPHLAAREGALRLREQEAERRRASESSVGGGSQQRRSSFGAFQSTSTDDDGTRRAPSVGPGKQPQEHQLNARRTGFGSTASSTATSAASVANAEKFREMLLHARDPPFRKYPTPQTHMHEIGWLHTVASEDKAVHLRRVAQMQPDLPPLAAQIAVENLHQQQRAQHALLHERPTRMPKGAFAATGNGREDDEKDLSPTSLAPPPSGAPRRGSGSATAPSPAAQFDTLAAELRFSGGRPTPTIDDMARLPLTATQRRRLLTAAARAGAGEEREQLLDVLMRQEGVAPAAPRAGRPGEYYLSRGLKNSDVTEFAAYARSIGETCTASSGALSTGKPKPKV
jgi:hypothetical protein